MTTAPEWPKIVDHIPIGGEWTLAFLVTSEDGLALADAGFTAGRSELRDSYADATSLLELGTAGGLDGTITITDVDETWTQISLHLPATATAGLSTPNPGSGQVRVLIGDVEVWSPAAATQRFRACDLRLYLRPNATTS